MSQRLAGVPADSPRELVAWMGAVQAQDYQMAKWALGVRLPGSTQREVEAALDRGEILRTHVLRPTWHIVSSEDIRWMLALTAPMIKAGLRSRHAGLGIAEEDIASSQAVMEQALGKQHLTRDGLIGVLEGAGIATAENRGYHLILLAELDGLICSGAARDGKVTYSLMAERVPESKHLERDEALRELAKRYFTSHGPATLEDFAWWSGLRAGDARRALEAAQPDLESENIDEQVVWYSSSVEMPSGLEESLHLLPAYDEFLISYKDRSAMLALRSQDRRVSSSGIFYPLVVWGGQVVGLWKRSVKRDRLLVQTEIFTPSETDQHTLNGIAAALPEAASRYGRFLDKEAEVSSNL